MPAFRVNTQGLGQLFASPVEPVQRHLRTIAQATAVRSHQLITRSRTGNLHRAIKAEPVSGSEPSWQVRIDASIAPYGLAYHEGTKPHRISARNAKALVFNWERFGNITTVVPKTGIRNATGQVVNFRSGGVLFLGKGYVDHPGTTARPILTRALEETVRRLS